MALIFWEGFDTHSNLTDLVSARPLITPGWYTRFGWWPDYSTTGGRFNGGKLSQANAVWGPGLINIGFITSPSEIYTGRAVKIGGTSSTSLLHVYGSSNLGNGDGIGDVYVTVNSGTVLLYNHQGTLLGQSVASIFSPNVWHWIELRVKMSSTTSSTDGIAELWLNNRKIISNTACITKTNSGSTGYSGLNLGCYDQFDSVDDIYILDTTGTSPWNTRLGDCRIASVAVTSDAGPNQGVPSTGIGNPHYTVVDEIPSNTSDYIELTSSANGYGEMFGHAPLPSNNAAYILATSVVVIGNKNDAGNGSFKISIQPPGGNTFNSNVLSLATGSAWYRQDWSVNPNTGIQWSKSDWANANIGFYIA